MISYAIITREENITFKAEVYYGKYYNSRHFKSNWRHPAVR